MRREAFLRASLTACRHSWEASLRSPAARCLPISFLSSQCECRGVLLPGLRLPRPCRSPWASAGRPHHILVLFSLFDCIPRAVTPERRPRPPVRGDPPSKGCELSGSCFVSFPTILRSCGSLARRVPEFLLVLVVCGRFSWVSGRVSDPPPYFRV